MKKKTGIHLSTDLQGQTIFLEFSSFIKKKSIPLLCEQNILLPGPGTLNQIPRTKCDDLFFCPQLIFTECFAGKYIMFFFFQTSKPKNVLKFWWANNLDMIMAHLDTVCICREWNVFRKINKINNNDFVFAFFRHKMVQWRQKYSENTSHCHIGCCHSADIFLMINS